MSKVEMKIDKLNNRCARCMSKCKGCDCHGVENLMNTVSELEEKGLLTKEDYEAYMRFMRG